MNAPHRRRQAHKAVFIGVEDGAGGLGDLLVKYLKKRFVDRSRTHVSHKPCKGGSYEDMFRIAQRVIANDAYDVRVLLWDLDRNSTGEDKMIHPEGFTVIAIRPCVEGALLELLGRSVPPRSKTCKTALNAVAPFNQMPQIRAYLDKIPNSTFEGHPELGQLLNIIRVQ